MGAHKSKLVTEYKERLRGIPFVPRFSYGCPMQEYDPATILYVIVIIFRLEKFELFFSFIA